MSQRLKKPPRKRSPPLPESAPTVLGPCSQGRCISWHSLPFDLVRERLLALWSLGGGRNRHAPAKDVLSSMPKRVHHFRGGVTPAGSGTCATFSVIDTRL